MDFITYSIIIDDIVFPDGRTCMGTMGGGGPQTAFGMRLWSDSVGIVARVGSDLPVSFLAWLEKNNIDHRGIRVTDLSTPRAWQVLDMDERRTQVWRVSLDVVQSHLNRKLDWIPFQYRHAKGYHFGIHPLVVDFNFIQSIRKLGGIVSVELFKPAEKQLSETEISKLLENIDIFSVNLEEAKSITAINDPVKIVRYLLSAGAGLVSIRMGKDGSLVAAQKDIGNLYHIPAFDITPVNPVGAGNAYCGGFLVGWSKTKDIITAGIYGSVSASLLIECPDLPIISDATKAEAHSRFDSLKSNIKSILNID